MDFYNVKQASYNNNPTNVIPEDVAGQNVSNQTQNLPVPIRPPRSLPTPSNQLPLIPPGEQTPRTVESIMYTPGYLRTQIGRMVRVEFLIGTNGLNDRIGTLLGVGASYILLRPIGTNDIELCDIYSIKFVTIYYRPLEVE